MAELKPCPFCGGEVYMTYASRDNAFKFYHKSAFDAAECPIIEPISMGNLAEMSLAEAAKAWNRRATMADLIDRQALLACFEEERRLSGYPYFHMDEIADEIIKAPAVDAVEVVRCKDCIGWTTWLKTKEPSVSMCGLSGLYVGNHRDDLFCPYGERREENAAD